MIAFNLDNLDLETQIEFLCIDTLNLWRHKIGILTKDFAISRLERRIILIIGRYPNIHQADLAEFLDVEPQSLTRTLEAMQKKDWLIKGNDAKDKRAKCLTLTQEGLIKLGAILKMSESIRPKVLKDISFEEKNNFMLILASIRENLKKI